MIFIVDDSEAMRERLAGMISEIDGLALAGQAASASEAIDGIRAARPAAVILDLHMPGGSGFEVLEALARDQWRPLLVVLTNHASRQYREKCLALGADYFLDKTGDLEQLSEIFKSLAARLSIEEKAGCAT